MASLRESNNQSEKWFLNLIKAAPRLAIGDTHYVQNGKSHNTLDTAKTLC